MSVMTLFPEITCVVLELQDPVTWSQEKHSLGHSCPQVGPKCPTGHESQSPVKALPKKRYYFFFRFLHWDSGHVAGHALPHEGGPHLVLLGHVQAPVVMSQV